MTEHKRIPYIQGAALVHGPAAMVLHRLIDRDEITTQMNKLGLKETWREATLGSLDAIDTAARSWQLRGSDSEPQSVQQQPQQAGFLDTMGTKEAAGILHYSESYVCRLLRTEVLLGRQAGRAWMIDAASVHALAKTNKERAAA